MFHLFINLLTSNLSMLAIIPAFGKKVVVFVTPTPRPLQGTVLIKVKGGGSALRLLPRPNTFLADVSLSNLSFRQKVVVFVTPTPRPLQGTVLIKVKGGGSALRLLPTKYSSQNCHLGWTRQFIFILERTRNLILIVL